MRFHLQQKGINGEVRTSKQSSVESSGTGVETTSLCIDDWMFASNFELYIVLKMRSTLGVQYSLGKHLTWKYVSLLIRTTASSFLKKLHGYPWLPPESTSWQLLFPRVQDKENAVNGCWSCLWMFHLEATLHSNVKSLLLGWKIKWVHLLDWGFIRCNRLPLTNRWYFKGHPLLQSISERIQ